MELPEYVRKKPAIFEYLPWLRGPAFTIYPRIYLPSDIYVNLQSLSPLASTVATLIHEQTHWQRQKLVGIWKFGLRYIFSKKFRLSEELMAIAPQIRYLKKYREKFDIDKRARALSSYQYLWATSYREAKKLLQSLS